MFLRQFFKIYKKAKADYKAEKYLNRQKKKLLETKTDFALLEKLIQEVNTKPELRVEVRLKDGTVLLLKTYREPDKKTVSQLISGEIGRYSNGSYIID